MVNLVVDIGNTCLKYAFFREGKIEQAGYEREEMVAMLGECAGRGEKVCIFLSGSGKIEEDLREYLKGVAGFWLEAGMGKVCLPLVIGYDTPETLGFDRVADCVGGRLFFPGKDMLVIDSGTAITYNYLSGDGVFLGGNISPGQDIRFRALNIYTKNLPYVEVTGEIKEFGKNTCDAIAAGVMKGILWEVKGCMEEFLASRPVGQVVVTGGYSMYLEGKLPEGVFFEKYLGLYGLNEILEFNKNVL